MGFADNDGIIGDRHDADTGRIVTAVFQALQSADQNRRDFTIADITNDPAHDLLLCWGRLFLGNRFNINDGNDLVIIVFLFCEIDFAFDDGG